MSVLAVEQHVLREEKLRLKGERRKMEGHDYTSGMISSFGHFAQQYGYFEIRMKVPRGSDMNSTTAAQGGASPAWR